MLQAVAGIGMLVGGVLAILNYIGMAETADAAFRDNGIVIRAMSTLLLSPVFGPLLCLGCFAVFLWLHFDLREKWGTGGEIARLNLEPPPRAQTPPAPTTRPTTQPPVRREPTRPIVVDEHQLLDDQQPAVACQWNGGETLTLTVVNRGATAQFEASARITEAEFDHKRFDVFRLRWEQLPYYAEMQIQRGRDGKLVIAELISHYSDFVVRVYEPQPKIAASWQFRQHRFFKFGILVEIHANPALREPWREHVLVDVDASKGIFHVGHPLLEAEQDD